MRAAYTETYEVLAGGNGGVILNFVPVGRLQANSPDNFHHL